jgi:hypothetical protein
MKKTIEINEIDQMVFVATCPRSGSSMDCGILERCGAFGGNTIGSTPANQRGIYENRHLNSIALNPILSKIGINSPRGLLTLSKAGGFDGELMAEFGDNLTYGFNSQGYESGVAYFKNGIYTFMFDGIDKHFPNAVWILPKRKIDNVMKSTRKLREGATDEAIMADIKDYHTMYDHIVEVCGERAHVLDNDKVAAGDFTHIKSIVESLGLEWDQEAVDDWIDDTLWHDESGNIKEAPQIKRRGGNNA